MKDSHETHYGFAREILARGRLDDYLGRRRRATRDAEFMKNLINSSTCPRSPPANERTRKWARDEEFTGGRFGAPKVQRCAGLRERTRVALFSASRIAIPPFDLVLLDPSILPRSFPPTSGISASLLAKHRLGGPES